MTIDVQPAARRRRTPVWLWLLLAMFALSVLLAGLLIGWLASVEKLPVTLVIDGTEMLSFDPSGLSAGHWATIAVGVVVAAMVAVVALVAAVVIGVVVGVGLPLLMLLLVTVVLCSPLLLLGALGVWLWRNSESRAARPAAPAAANIAG